MGVNIFAALVNAIPQGYKSPERPRFFGIATPVSNAIFMELGCVYLRSAGLFRDGTKPLSSLLPTKRLKANSVKLWERRCEALEQALSTFI